MVTTSGGWIMLDDLPDGSEYNKLLGAVIADVTRPARQFMPLNVASELPADYLATPTTYSNIDKEWSLEHDTDVKAKLGSVFGVYFNKDHKSSRHMTTKIVKHYSLEHDDLWFDTLSSKYDREIRTMMDRKPLLKSEVYLVTDIKVCQDAVIVTKDASNDQWGGNVTLLIKETLPIIGIFGKALTIDINPTLTLDHTYTLTNDDSLVADGSRIYAIKCDVIKRSFWTDIIESQPMNRFARPADWRGEMEGGRAGSPPAEHSTLNLHKADSAMAEISDAFPDVTWATLCDSGSS